MTKASIYQRFVRAVWARLKQDHPFVTRLDRPLCVAIPRSSSFYAGRSPMNGKHFLFDFQHSPKPWQGGQFTINVHISTELEATDNFSAFSGYEDATDGYYRLASACLGFDKWWCLKDRDRSFDDEMRRTLPNFDPAIDDEEFFRQNWRPSSYEDPELVIREALEDVLSLLQVHLFDRFAFTSTQWPRK